MRLIVVIGYPDDSRASDPFPVYAGRDSKAAEAAMGQSTAVLFDIIKNPTVVRKRNKAVVAPVVPLAGETVAEAAVAPPDGADGPIGEPGPAGTEGSSDANETASAPAKAAPAGAVSGKRGRA